MRTLVIWICVTVAPLCGCNSRRSDVTAGSQWSEVPADARSVLESADRLVLYSLDPLRDIERTDDERAKPFDGEMLRDWRVLGKVEISDRKQIERLSEAFKSEVQNSDGSVAACFWPRHAIRATRDGKEAEFILCFECLRAQAHSGSEEHVVPLEGKRKNVFDAPLLAAGVPLAKSMLPDDSLE
jgi:hypothetical protein